MSDLQADCAECGCPAATKWSERDWRCPSCGSEIVVFSLTDTPSTQPGS